MHNVCIAPPSPPPPAKKPAVTATADSAPQSPASGVRAVLSEPVLAGRGGGRPDMAQGGGNNPAALPAALESVKNWVSEQGA